MRTRFRLYEESLIYIQLDVVLQAVVYRVSHSSDPSKQARQTHIAIAIIFATRGLLRSVL